MSSPTVSWTLLAPSAAPAPITYQGSKLSPTQLPIDLALDVDGDLALPLRYTTGPDAVAQGIRIRILTFMGELAWNLDYGVPYYQEILGHKFNQARVRNAFIKAIDAAPGVDAIVALTADFDPRSRVVTINWTVRTSFGVIAGIVGV